MNQRPLRPQRSAHTKLIYTPAQTVLYDVSIINATNYLPTGLSGGVGARIHPTSHSRVKTFAVINNVIIKKEFNS